MFSVPHEIRVGSAAIPRIIFQFQSHAFCFISMLGVGTYLRTIGSSISRYYRPSHTYCDFSQRMSPACQPHNLSLASERCLRVETEFPPLQRDHAARTPWNITAPCSSHPIEHNRLLSAYKNRCGSPPSRSALPFTQSNGTTRKLQRGTAAVSSHILHGNFSPRPRTGGYTVLGHFPHGCFVSARIAWGDVPVPHWRSHARCSKVRI